MERIRSRKAAVTVAALSMVACGDGGLQPQPAKVPDGAAPTDARGDGVVPQERADALPVAPRERDAAAEREASVSRLDASRSDADAGPLQDVATDSAAIDSPVSTLAEGGLDGNVDAGALDGEAARPPRECSEGTTESCGSATGACAGTRSCRGGVWEECRDSREPSVEVCDGIDNDCDGVVDDGVTNRCGRCGALPEEICDGVDNDCDGEIDEGVRQVYFADFDGDGFGDASRPTEACAPPSQYVAGAGDCDNGNSSAYPGQSQMFGVPRGNGSFDYNCDGTTTLSETHVVDGCVSGWGGAVPGCGERGTFVRRVVNFCGVVPPCSCITISESTQTQLCN